VFEVELQQLSAQCYVLRAAVNIGYITTGGKGLLIDTGVDDSSIKKAIKLLEKEKLPLDYCIITHAHADHFGGANYLKKTMRIPLYAPKVEKAIIENSVLEPIYLFNGSFPIAELRNKFLEGKSVPIDHVVENGKGNIGPFSLEIIPLPGHSYGQIAILSEGILYAADSYFGESTLKKHVIPFINDADQTIESLHKLKEIPCKGAVPGHGEFEENFHGTVQKNIELHEKMIQMVREQIEEATGKVTFSQLLKTFLACNELNVGNLGQWLLFRTSFTAYISSLVKKGIVQYTIQDNELWVTTITN
jgi:glyoxylase-like metal-dependent hydrolase (beta-lactamase superfamily II)